MRASRTPRKPSEAAWLRNPPREPSRPRYDSHRFTSERTHPHTGEVARSEQQRICDVVRLARKRRLPQSLFAERLGESQADVRRWEDGSQAIPRAVRARIAAILDLDPRVINAEAEPTLTALEWDVVLLLRRRAEAEQERGREFIRGLPTIPFAVSEDPAGMPK